MQYRNSNPRIFATKKTNNIKYEELNTDFYGCGNGIAQLL